MSSVAIEYVIDISIILIELLTSKAVFNAETEPLLRSFLDLSKYLCFALCFALRGKGKSIWGAKLPFTLCLVGMCRKTGGGILF